MEAVIKIKRIYILLLFHIITLSSLCAHNNQKILVLNSYHPQYKWTQILSGIIILELEKIVNPENISVEYMDARRFGADTNFITPLKDLYRFKYSNHDFDLIISTDNYAYNFLLDCRDDIFGSVPVVFCGLNFPSHKKLIHKDGFTGALEGIAIEKNLDLILELFPNINEIIIVGDKTKFVEDFLQEVEIIKANEKYNKLKLTIWNDFIINDLQNRLRNLNDNQAVLMTAILKDKNNEYFSYAHDMQILADNCPVPIFGMWGGLLIGNGVLGGYMNDPEFHALETIEIANQVLHGTSPQEIPVISKTKYYPQFDYNLLSKFNLNLDDLPQNSKIHFQPESFFKLHKNIIYASIFTVVFLIGVILILYINIQRRKRAEVELAILNKELEFKVKERTEKLKKLNTQKDRLFSVISHDLRAPFNSLLGISSELSKNIDHYSMEEIKESGNIIYSSANNLLHLLENLLRWSKIQIGHAEFNPQKINLNSIIDTALIQLSTNFVQKNIEIVKQIDSSLDVYADEFMLNSILRNFISNAIKFSFIDSKIEIIAEEKSQNVIITIKDFGMGMNKETIDNLFLVNNNSSKIGTNDEKGSGLGLILCKEFVELHGSEIIVKSELGQGSSFSFEIKSS